MSHFLLIGLGNPGSEYSGNRHNVGFMAVDAVRSQYSFGKESKKMGGLLCEGTVDGKKLLTFKPQSYMNLSGEPTQKLAHFYKIPLQNIIVIHDDLDLALGKIKIKRGGGNGGHNGLKSLDANIGADYVRVRVGIGHPGNKDLVSDYVLSDFHKEEWPVVETLVNEMSKHLPLLLQGDEAGFMNKIVLGTGASG